MNCPRCGKPVPTPTTFPTAFCPACGADVRLPPAGPICACRLRGRFAPAACGADLRLPPARPRKPRSAATIIALTLAFLLLGPFVACRALGIIGSIVSLLTPHPPPQPYAPPPSGKPDQKKNPPAPSSGGAGVR